MDREKVIEGLEACSTGKCTVVCPYHATPQCTRAILIDALALLKEQEAKTGEWLRKQPKYPSATGGSRTAFCSLCGDWGRKSFKFCPHCGAKMET